MGTSKLSRKMTQTPTVPREELVKVPYVANLPNDKRIVFLNPFFNAEHKKWELPFPQDDKIIFLKAEPSQSCYYSDKKMGESDLFLKLIDYTARYFSFYHALQALFGITRDIFNCGVVVERYFLYLDMFRENKDTSIMNIVLADIEFLFSNIRSAFDSLQFQISTVWNIEKKTCLPRRFSEIIKCDTSDFKQKYDLPMPLINCYQKYKDFFDKCKQIRDGIHHLSIDIKTVFCLEDGFALQKSSFLSEPITRYFDIWAPEKMKKNNLVSVLALYAYLNKNFLESTESFSESLKEAVSKVPLISSEYKLFLRGPYLNHLINSEKYLKQHWIPP
jgi:hypothetical protein